MLANLSFAAINEEPMSTPDIDHAIAQLEAMLARRKAKFRQRQPVREINRMDRPINTANRLLPPRTAQGHSQR